MTSPRFNIFLLSALVLCSLGFVYGQSDNVFEVYVGFSTNDTSGTWDFHKFFPDILYVKAGDQVNFMNYGGTHTVVFNPEITDLFNGTTANDTYHILSDYLLPVGDTNFTSTDQEASSGFLSFNQTYSVTFSKPGTYNYLCILHYPEMQGTIVVLADNDTDVTGFLSPEDSEDQVHDALNILVNKTIPDLSVVKGIDTDTPASRLGDGGSHVYTVRMVGDHFSKASRMEFVPESFEVTVGDTVEFVNDDIGVHTVSFNTSGDFEEELIFDGPSNHFWFNSLFVTASGDASDYSDGFLSSGILYPLWLPYTDSASNATIARYFRVTFTAPGAFPFRCDFHYEEGMTGVITVASPASSSTVAAPSTASSESSSGGGSETSAGSSAV
jgi:plastocyanin